MYFFIFIFLQPVFSFPNHLLCCRYLWPQVPISNYSYSTEGPRPPHIGDTLSFSNNNAQDIFLFSLIISGISSTFPSHYQKHFQYFSLSLAEVLLVHFFLIIRSTLSHYVQSWSVANEIISSEKRLVEKCCSVFFLLSNQRKTSGA